MNNISLNLVVLRSADAGRAEVFYGRLGLAFRRHRHGTGPEHLSAEMAGGGVFEIYTVTKGAASTLGTRVGFAVDSVDAVVATLGEDFPGAVVSPAKDSEWGRRAVLADPDGHRVEVVEKRN